MKKRCKVSNDELSTEEELSIMNDGTFRMTYAFDMIKEINK